MSGSAPVREDERIVPGTEIWKRSYPDHIQRYRFAIERMPRGARVLDAGCGVGYGAAEMADGGAVHVTAVDISSDALGIARREFDRASITWLQDDCQTLERAAAHAPFDLIINFENLEHLERPQDLVARASSLLAADGMLLTSTPNRTLLNRLRGVRDDAPSANPYHLNELNETEFRSLLLQHFATVEMYYQSPLGAERRRLRRRARAARWGVLPLLRFIRRLLRRDGTAAATAAEERAWRIDAEHPGDDVAWTLIAVCRGPRSSGAHTA